MVENGLSPCTWQATLTAAPKSGQRLRVRVIAAVGAESEIATGSVPAVAADDASPLYCSAMGNRDSLGVGLCELERVCDTLWL